jgi:hypothetical protein
MRRRRIDEILWNMRPSRGDRFGLGEGLACDADVRAGQ